MTSRTFSEQVVKPAMSAMAQIVDTDLLAVGVQEADNTATVSGTPVITDIAGVGKARYCEGSPRKPLPCAPAYNPVQV